MTGDEMKAMTLRVFEEAFNKGNLTVIDETLMIGAVDHQETPGSDFRRRGDGSRCLTCTSSRCATARRPTSGT